MNPRRTIAVACISLTAVLLALSLSPAAAGAQTRARAFDPELLRSGDLIRYRAIERSDFRARTPPEEAGVPHGQLGAATCVYLTTSQDTTIHAVSEASEAHRGLVRAQVENLGFIAYMDRRCSWWNPRDMGLPEEYILQHEQIHFALFELAGRRLNARAEELMANMRTVSKTQQEAFEELGRRIDIEMQRMLQEVMGRSNDFDRETSRTYRQDRQDWWWETVSRELERVGAPSSGR